MNKQPAFVRMNPLGWCSNCNCISRAENWNQSLGNELITCVCGRAYVYRCEKTKKWLNRSGDERNSHVSYNNIHSNFKLNLRKMFTNNTHFRYFFKYIMIAQSIYNTHIFTSIFMSDIRLFTRQYPSPMPYRYKCIHLGMFEFCNFWHYCNNAQMHSNHVYQFISCIPVTTYLSADENQNTMPTMKSHFIVYFVGILSSNNIQRFDMRLHSYESMKLNDIWAE